MDLRGDGGAHGSVNGTSVGMAAADAPWRHAPPLHISARLRPDAARATLAEHLAAYLAAPSDALLAAIYRLTRRASPRCMSASHAAAISLDIRLLDALAAHALTLAQTAPPSWAMLQHALDVAWWTARHLALGYPSPAVGKLLTWLAASVAESALRNRCASEPVLKLQLLVLAELLRQNAGARLFVKDLPRIKELYRALTVLLNRTEDAELLVPSMAILARLVLSDALGAKLFSAKNVPHALELVIAVVDGSWTRTHAARIDASRLSDLLQHSNALSELAIELLADLSERDDILQMLQDSLTLQGAIDAALTAIHLHANAAQLQTALLLLATVVTLGARVRRRVLQQLGKPDAFARVLQIVLHPTKSLGALAGRLLMDLASGDVDVWRSTLAASANEPSIRPILSGLLRVVHEQAVLVQQSEDMTEISMVEEYELSAIVCRLLAKLSDVPLLGEACMDGLLFDESASVIQTEAAFITSADPHLLPTFQPRLSIGLVFLLSRLHRLASIADTVKRKLAQLLQSADVAVVLGMGWTGSAAASADKIQVSELLLLLCQILSDDTRSAKYAALTLADGIFTVNQRLAEAHESQQGTIASLGDQCGAYCKTIEQLRGEIQQAQRVQDQLQTRHEQELQEFKVRTMEQQRAQEDAVADMRHQYEAKQQELNAQCESMAQLLNKKAKALSHHDQMLQDQRLKQARVEEENTELARKVQVLEVRLEEVAQHQAHVLQDRNDFEHELKNLQEEMTTLSSEYTTQCAALEQAKFDLNRLGGDLKERANVQERVFKELVLLAKDHKAIAEEKDALRVEVESLRDALSKAECYNHQLESRVKEEQDQIECQAREIKSLQDAETRSTAIAEEEREKRRVAVYQLDELGQAQRRLESDMAMADIRAAEAKAALATKDERLRKCEDEIRALTVEVSKHAKLQQLIHQLSSGGDAQALAAGAFLARDS